MIFGSEQCVERSVNSSCVETAQYTPDAAVAKSS